MRAPGRIRVFLAAGHSRLVGGVARAVGERALLEGLAALLAALAFVVAALTNAPDVGAVAFMPSVVLLAWLHGSPAGALAGLVGAGLYGLAATVGGAELSTLSAVSAAVVMVALGAGIGRLAVRVRELQSVATMFRAVFDATLDAVLLFDDDHRMIGANGAVADVLGTSPDAMIGRRIGDRAPPERRRRLEDMLRALREQGAIRGEYDLTGPDGETRSVEFTATRDFVPGLHLAVIRDCTERKRAEEALRQRAAEQADIADFGFLALAGLDLDELMEVIVDRLARRLEVERVSVVERRGGDDEALVRAEAGRSLTPGDSEEAHRLVQEQRIANGACVPIRGRERSWGGLALYSRSDQLFSSDAVNFLRAVANTLAMAIDSRRAEEEVRRRSAEVARLAAERQQIVAEALNAEDRTRERISQQLHDELLQSLFVIRQDLAQVAATGDARPDLVIRARDGLRQAIRDLRAAVFDLHPVVLERGGLASALHAIAEHHAEHGGFEMSVAVSPDAEGRLDRLALSIVRELVSNVARHAAARHAHVTVERREEELLLEVGDDGRGIRPENLEQAVAHGHIGLASVGQRVEALGGRFDVSSPPSGGTVVRAAIPIGANVSV